MSQQPVSLGRNLDPVRCVSPSELFGDEHFTYIDIGAINREDRLIANVQRIAVQEAPSRARQLVQSGDILVSTVRPNLNTVAMVPGDLDGAIASTGFCVLRANKNLDRRYLFHWVSSENVVRHLSAVATGASYPAVSEKIIKSMPVNFPCIEEQKRIAAILDKADSLRRKRRQAIHLADDFLRAVFLEMFGDPVTNSRKWPEKEIYEIAKVITGNTPSRETPENFGSTIEWIKSDNINTPSHWLTKAAEGLSEQGLRLGRTAPAGSTLMTCIAGTPSCIGNVAMADRQVAFNQQINALTPFEGTEPEFLYGLLLYSKQRIQDASTNSMKGMVSKGALERVRLIWPTADLQSSYAMAFRKITTLCEKQLESDSAPLFSSLQDSLLS
ncbi:restriction endonuclease subunit S [Zoogloea dura]|uniref:Restriction endonuclease subunit S n=1 Tax=Zoogloea dura TaxID=2728840 RepID=A0A848GD33_9RHOO|nr:restriction endonuclease subunit S [Zoogloea dura]NML29022.1 restriction endonuclease subunit S [Zoogloea dura]